MYGHIKYGLLWYLYYVYVNVLYLLQELSRLLDVLDHYVVFRKLLDSVTFSIREPAGNSDIPMRGLSSIMLLTQVMMYPGSYRWAFIICTGV
jgi:hypothetical protein